MYLGKITQRYLLPVIQAAGFIGTKEAFDRRHGATIQVLEIQRSLEDSWASPHLFYMNIGIAFDDLRMRYNKPAADQPKASECDFHGRLSDLVPNSPLLWAIARNGLLDKLLSQLLPLSGIQHSFEIQDEETAGRRLAADIRQALVELDKIEGPQTFMQSNWKNAPGNDILRAILLYEVGDLEGAWRELQRVSRKFANREGMTIPVLIDRLKLIKLKDRLS